MRFICKHPFLISVLAGAAFFSTASFGSPSDLKPTYVTVDPDGTDYGPQFSPDSRRLIFERRPMTGGRAETYEVPVEGGAPKPFLKEKAPVAQTRLRWSSATNKIAFTGITAKGSASSWLIDGDGTHVHPAYAPDGTNTYYPSWYADGRRLVELDGDREALRIVNLGSGKMEPLTTTPALLTGMASVSPDGKSIAVAAQRNLGQPYNQSVNQIWLISGKGKAHPLEKAEMEGRAPTWSPDGSRLLFESNRGSPMAGFYAIFVADMDGTNVRQLTPFAWNAQHPVWSPDGKWIAFSARHVKATGFGPDIAIMAAPTPAN